MANIRRLIFKRFGGTSNFLSYMLLTIIVYLLIRSYTQSDVDVIEAEPSIEAPKGGGKILLTDKKIAKEETEKSPKVLPQPEVFDKECEIQEKCSWPQIPYRVTSGSGMDIFPTICFNGKIIVGKNLKDVKMGRGINIVVIDKDAYSVKYVNYFDTFTEDASFLRYIKTDLMDGDIVLIASYDEMTNGLREGVLSYMQHLGSQLFSNVKFRDSFVMIGQKGVLKGKAIEMHEAKKDKDFAPSAVISGCISFPLGIVHPIKALEMQVNSADKIEVKEVSQDCGLRSPCKEDEFAVHVYSGVNSNDEPKICVDGRYVIAKGINDAGRGINIVIVGNGKEILKTAHFDTYAEDSTNLEIFLEGLFENTIIIAVTFDEASTKLAMLARNLFFDLGSGLVQNLRFRDSWFFVGKKGIQGFTPIEEISYAGPEDAYPKVIDRRFCVPQTLKGQRIRPDPLPTMNDGRRDFCSRYDGYGDFCSNENMDKPLKPAPIINKTLEEHPVYNMPILVVSGMSHNSLRMTLETVIMQPGVRPDLVHVCVDEKLLEQRGLVELFGFNYVSVKSSGSYEEIYQKSLSEIWSKEYTNRNKDSIIVIEEELILSPDFLYFFSQLYEAYINDPTVAAVSAWNSNSFLQLDGSSSYLYRTNDFPGLGYMLKKSVYMDYMKDKLNTCCKERVWNNWRLTDQSGQHVNLDVIIPDVSRVFRRPYDLSQNDFSYVKSLFNRKRKTNLIPFPELYDLNEMATNTKYSAFISEKLKTAHDLDVQSCYSTGKVVLPNTTNEYYKVVFEQSDGSDLSKLKTLTRCFHLFNHLPDKPPKGLYLDSIIRFHSQHNNFILIGSKNKLIASI